MKNSLPRPTHREDFRIAIICALPLEASAVQALFDICWDEYGINYGKAAGDPNAYTTGRVGGHDVVLAHMPGMGKGIAASVASSLRSSYQRIQLALVVGICGGVPFVKEGKVEKEIILGDVVISEGIVQYDFGRRFLGKFVRKDDIRDNFSRLNADIRSFLARLKAAKGLKRLQDRMLHHLEIFRDNPCTTYPGIDKDKLFDSSYRHKHQELAACELCSNCRHGRDPVCHRALISTCDQLKCDENMLLPRRRHVAASEDQEVPNPAVHFGLIASGDAVARSGLDRDEIAAREGVIAFEMEGAGVWDNFPCIVIKGVCDYADSHKNKDWQEYAAATAAACMKAFLEEWAVLDEPFSKGSQSKSSLVASLNLDEGNHIYFITDMNSPPGPLFGQLAHVNRPIAAGKLQSLLDSLEVPGMNARLQGFKKPHDITCTWLFEQSEYKDWLNPDKTPEHHGFLCIKGKPGVGKSTMMKQALAHVRNEIKHATVISFFFNAKGKSYEKSALGMYRSLLFQLLTEIPEVQNQFNSSAMQKCGDGYEWDVEELQDILVSVINSIGRRHICCFIDAVDECGEDQVRDMVEFLEELGEVAIESETRLNICLSSRHYPHIGMKKCVQLVIEDQPSHYLDIEKYVDSKLKVGCGKKINDIKTEILSRASGVFLWVVLIVQKLNKAYDHGQTHALRRRLRETPDELNHLFSNILTGNDQNKEELVLCLQWILYAQRPLRPTELYFAIRSGLEPTELTEWNQDEITEEDMEKYILSCSKGLAETTKDKDRTVRLIHESVRGFLLRDGLVKFTSDLEDNIAGSSHERLKQCCHNYIKNIDISQHVPLEVPLARASSKTRSLRKSVSEQFPFLEYAVHNMLHHSDIAESHGISQKRFLESFSLDDDADFRLRTLITLENLFEQHEINGYPPDAGIFYMLDDKGLSNLLRVHTELDPIHVNAITKKRHGTPINVASFNHNQKAHPVLRDSGSNVNANACAMNKESHEAAIQNQPQNRDKIKSQTSWELEELALV